MRNLEAKFRLSDLAIMRRRADSIGYSFRALLNQRDTFFTVANGKLKLREQPDGAWLIHYARQEREGLLLSNYEIVVVAEPERTRTMLSCALGVLAEVRKERTLLMRDNVRFHLDRVEGLGEFGEIEAVIADGGDPARNQAAVDELLAAIGIAKLDLIDVSYFELACAAKASR